MSVRDALREATGRLSRTSESARLDAELLMAHALGETREAMLLSSLGRPVPAAFAALVDRRLAHEPIAYITRRRAFWTIELEVGPGVLIPRPDSETLIDAAAEHFGAAGPANILDLGTGPGTLLLAALAHWPQARGLGVDASPGALDFARGNAARLGLAGRARFSAGDWAGGIAGTFDLVLCNPPYVEAGAGLPPDVARWEPAEALYAGDDGLDAYRRLAPELPRLLAPEGIACFEIGTDQSETAGALFAAQGLRVALRTDLGGRPRCLLLRH